MYPRFLEDIISIARGPFGELSGKSPAGLIATTDHSIPTVVVTAGGWRGKGKGGALPEENILVLYQALTSQCHPRAWCEEEASPPATSTVGHGSLSHSSSDGSIRRECAVLG